MLIARTTEHARAICRAMVCEALRVESLNLRDADRAMIEDYRRDMAHELRADNFQEIHDAYQAVGDIAADYDRWVPSPGELHLRTEPLPDEPELRELATIVL